MDISTSPELYWAIITALFTSVLWMPHILQRIIEMRPYEAFRDPRHDVATKALWAQRAIKAHTNAIENLVVFAVFATVIHIQGMSTALTASASAVYFIARVGHYGIYVLGVPWLRTPAYLVGFGCQTILGLTILGYL